MKQIKTYHIEHYWQTEAIKRKKRAEARAKLYDVIRFGAFIILLAALYFEFYRQLFEII